MGKSRRTIPEELLLLALDPTTGTTAQPQSLDLGLAGAQLVELALAGRIAPDGDRIAVVAPRPTGDPTLDSALELLRRRGAPVRAVNWIGGPRTARPQPGPGSRSATRRSEDRPGPRPRCPEATAPRFHGARRGPLSRSPTAPAPHAGPAPPHNQHDQYLSAAPQSPRPVREPLA